MGFGDAWEKMIMSHRFNIQSYATSELWVGLSSQDPLDDASGVSEPPGKGYARVKTNEADGTSWQVSDATGTTVDNAEAIEFNTATDDWGTMTHFALFSGSTAGASVLCHGALTSSKSVDNGDTARFAAGELDICLK
jgi:hypothetical protein